MSFWQRVLEVLKQIFAAKLQPQQPQTPIENVSPVPVQPKPGISARVLGIDVSHYEPPVDWAKAKAGGVQWMYTKASEGISNLDKTLESHVRGAQAAGVLAGAYHFFHADEDAATQADRFLATFTNLKLEMPPCLDWEAGSARGVPSEVQQDRALIWLHIVEKATGKIPVIYGGEAFLRELKLRPEFARYPAWLAHYGVKESQLRVPSPWTKLFAWQYTESGSVPGLAAGHHVDCNLFFGGVPELRAFAGVQSA